MKRTDGDVTNGGMFGEARHAVWAMAATLIAAVALTALAPHDKDLRAAAVGLAALAVAVPVWLRVWWLPRAHTKPSRPSRMAQP